uniref:Transglutaminase C-terminal domain-containing protein n=1 Tax=Timema genevievae TaxID=629358 RepID=A0A7R9PMW6_TIMGE|nr:unnamed protein product [Timema genevievae]
MAIADRCLTDRSATERLALMNAVRGVERAKRFYELPSISREELEFELVDLDRVNIGESFSVVVNINNKSNSVKTVKAILSAASVYYTGIKAHLIKKASGDFQVQPKSITGDLPEMVTSTTVVLQVTEDLPEMVTSITVVLQVTGDLSELVTLITLVLQVTGDLSEMVISITMVLQVTGYLPEMVTSITVVLQVTEDLPEMVTSITVVLQVTGDLSELVTSITVVLQVTGDLSEMELLKLTVKPDDYLDKLVEYCNMKIYALATVADTNETWGEEDDFQIIKPKLDIKGYPSRRVGSPGASFSPPRNSLTSPELPPLMSMTTQRSRKRGGREKVLSPRGQEFSTWRSRRYRESRGHNLMSDGATGCLAPLGGIQLFSRFCPSGSTGVVTEYLIMYNEVDRPLGSKIVARVIDRAWPVVFEVFMNCSYLFGETAARFDDHAWDGAQEDVAVIVEVEDGDGRHLTGDAARGPVLHGGDVGVRVLLLEHVGAFSETAMGLVLFRGDNPVPTELLEIEEYVSIQCTRLGVSVKARMLVTGCQEHRTKRRLFTCSIASRPWCHHSSRILPGSVAETQHPHTGGEAGEPKGHELGHVDLNPSPFTLRQLLLRGGHRNCLVGAVRQSVQPLDPHSHIYHRI